MGLLGGPFVLALESIGLDPRRFRLLPGARHGGGTVGGVDTERGGPFARSPLGDELLARSPCRRLDRGQLRDLQADVRDTRELLPRQIVGSRGLDRATEDFPQRVQGEPVVFPVSCGARQPPL